MAKDLKFCELLELYGKLLTPRQLEIMSFYYFEDYSLSEIGLNLSIDRQTVKTIIKRAETVLVEYEDKLNLLEKFNKISGIAEKMNSVSDKSQINNFLDEIIKITRE
ncbi:putative DNA-binding protein [Clostridia bacterium]|nr:putative DNA-binding protein [Clostridia bacterium]